jgi:CheY-like chemotaxis protein
VTPRPPIASPDSLVTKLAAHLTISGPLPRMEAIALLEQEGLGFHEAIEALTRAIEAGTLARKDGGAIEAAPVSPRKKNCVLIVDDEPAIRTQLGELLREEGYDVLEAADGYQAMDCLREPPHPSMVLLDLILPGPSGWEVLAWMRELPALASLPVWILSGMGDEIRVDGTNVLTKPPDLDELLAAVARHCK